MLHRISLHLARNREFPQGSSARGYDIVAPLDSQGRLDPEAWREERGRCSVRRFWPGEPDRHGVLIHRAGGAHGATWIIDYDNSTEEDDEAGYRLDTHRFAEGEYVSIRDEDGVMQTFTVTRVGRA